MDVEDEPLDGSLFGPDQPCFGCSPTHPHGLRLRFERIAQGVETRYVPRDTQQGALHLMHGGLIMTLADETAAWAIIAETGRFGFTTHATCRFRAPVRVGVEVTARARITRNVRRVVVVEVELEQNGERCFSGEYRFAILDKQGAERLMGAPLPEAWQRFGRDG